MSAISLISILSFRAEPTRALQKSAPAATAGADLRIRVRKSRKTASFLSGTEAALVGLVGHSE
jgi:hypothetical protein